VQLGDGVYVGCNATILPEVTVGAWATIGAGSVAMRDVPAGATLMGVPGRVVLTADIKFKLGEFNGLPHELRRRLQAEASGATPAVANATAAASALPAREASVEKVGGAWASSALYSLNGFQSKGAKS
jgi:hypothetical protein